MLYRTLFNGRLGKSRSPPHDLEYAMNKYGAHALAAAFAVAGVAMTASAADPTPKPAPKVTATKPAAPKPAAKDQAAILPPVDQRIERQNSPADKLVVEVTHSAKAEVGYVAYIKIRWGDLDNVIKGTGSQYYANWDGGLKLAGGARAIIENKIQFEDKGKPAAASAKNNGKNGTGTVAGPHVGSGRDEVEIAAGPLIEWKSGVVGILDGLRIKITSPIATISGTLIAGKFTIPINITLAPADAAKTPQPAPSSTSGTPSSSVLIWPARQ